MHVSVTNSNVGFRSRESPDVMIVCRFVMKDHKIICSFHYVFDIQKEVDIETEISVHWSIPQIPTMVKGGGQGQQLGTQLRSPR